jgi:NAD(P)-dependent dehydrogenase (short-subunit alcohol dehydrogenase family)
MNLAGRSALITGASHGLGLAIARALIDEGAAVACVARPGAQLEAAVAGLAANGGRAIAVPADVTQAAQVAGAVRDAAAALGGLDIVVLNAGTWLPGTIVETTEATWDQLLDLNLKHAYLTLHEAVPHLVRRGGGTIVGISSIGGVVGQPGSVAYAASKWGLRGLLESVALGVRADGIRVSIVSPHNINSAGRTIAPGSKERSESLEPADIAALVAHICTAPPYVSIGNVTIWPLAVGIATQG